MSLRNPIQPILGLSEILLSKKGNIEQDKELLNVIVRNAKRLQKLTENILDATKIESQSLKLNKQYCRLNDIITNVLADHKKEEKSNKQRKIKFLSYSNNNTNNNTITFKVGLELAEFDVDAYNDSAIALSNFKPDYYHLLLIDVKMPKIDGFELYEKIRKIDDKVMVWFITAYETYYKLKEVSSTSKGEMSSIPVISKPVEIDKLVKQIKAVLH